MSVEITNDVAVCFLPECYNKFKREIQKSKKTQVGRGKVFRAKLEGDDFISTLWLQDDKMYVQDPSGVRECISHTPKLDENTQVGTIKGWLLRHFTLKYPHKSYKQIADVIIPLKPIYESLWNIEDEDEVKRQLALIMALIDKAIGEDTPIMMVDVTKK